MEFDEIARIFIKVLMVMCLVIMSYSFYINPLKGENVFENIAVIIGGVMITLSAAFALIPDKMTRIMVGVFAVILFVSTFLGVCFSILFYDIMPFNDSDRLRDAQVLLAVSSSGAMGGLMRYFSHEAVTRNKELDAWKLIHATIVGLFVSLVLFLILRAGIINQTKVDTFNVWGVAGVSAITGFFSEKMLERFSSIYNEIVG